MTKAELIGAYREVEARIEIADETNRDLMFSFLDKDKGLGGWLGLPYCCEDDDGPLTKDFLLEYWRQIPARILTDERSEF